MTGRDERTGDDPLHAEAVAWLVRVQSDAATAEDWAALSDWLEGSEPRQRAFEDAEQASLLVDSLAPQIAAGLAERPATVVALPRPRQRPERRALIGFAIAACCLVIAAPLLWRVSQGTETVYRTGPGQLRNVTLADGSLLRLDAASTVKVRLGWRVRRVEMADAQASFDVAKDPQRPFLIDVGDKTVRVVGTKFNIRHYDRGFVLTVARGIVEVRPSSSDAAVRLQAGDQVRGRDGSPDLVRTRADPTAAFAWTDNRLEASDRPLTEIVAVLNRRYAVPIRLGPAAAGRRFSGSLDLGEKEDAVVRRLSAFLGLPVHRNAGEYTLG